MDCAVAWAAGLFEGEGCFDHKEQAHRPRATMSLTDRDVLERFVAIVGVGTIGPVKRRAPHHKDAWQWWTDEAGFYVVLGLFRPWLSPRRIAAADEAIKARAAHIQTVIAERECYVCHERFQPAFSRVSGRRSRCSKTLCQQFRPSKALKRAIARPEGF